MNRFKDVELREGLANALLERMATDDRILIMNADLGASMKTGEIEKTYPDRAIEVGIAEQNMASMAGGLSSYGYIPFIYSFAPFVTRRVADQIAVSIAYAHQNVKIVGTDPGITAELNGGTHMAFEDVAILRSLPNAVIFEPSDTLELVTAMDQIIAYDGLVYIRTGRKVTPALHDDSYKCDLFAIDVLKEGTDVTIAATGMMVNEALEAGKILEEKGIQAEVLNIHTVKPLDVDTLIKSVKKTGAIVTCENHNVMGGLRSAVAEALVENYPVPLESVGVKEKLGEVGKLSYLKKAFNMTAEDIVKATEKVIGRK